MKKLITVLVMLISCGAFSQSEKVINRFLTYGMNCGYNEARELVAKDWGIKVYPIVGCVISQKLKDSIKTVHKKLWLRMDSIHGINSKKRFQKELLSEEKKITEVYEIFYSDKSIKKRKKEIYETDGITSIQQIEKVSKDRNLYYVILYTVDTSNLPKLERKPDLKIEVNIIEKKTKIIELE